MESCGSEKCREEQEKIPGGKGSQVYRTMLLRDCGDEVNRKVVLQNPHKTRYTPLSIDALPYTAPTDRQAHDQ